jgi:hypothetical protein
MTEGKSLVELYMLTIIKKAIDRKRAMQARDAGGERRPG